MRHIIFEESPTGSYKVAVLIKGSAFNKSAVETSYVTPLNQRGIPRTDIIGFSLKYGDNNKASATVIKDYLKNLLPALNSLGTKVLYVADASYFKVLVSKSRADPHHGYVMPCTVKGYEHMSVVLGVNHTSLIFNPDLQAKLDQSLDAVSTWLNGTYTPPGNGIIHSAYYPEGLQAVKEALESLHQYPSLTCDTETFSLAFHEAGVGTISFAWDKHHGIAFPVDYKEIWDKHGSYHQDCDIDIAAYEGFMWPNLEVRALLVEFFTTYKGELTFHKADYDIGVLIYTLWMKDLGDTEGLLTGLEAMTKRFHDTKIIAYLATNSTAGNVLGLKALAHEFAGNWAVEVKDIRTVKLKDLLQYNLVDALATHYVREKYYPIMVADQQEDLYHSLMLPSLKLIIQLELTGMPLNAARVQEVKTDLQDKQDICLGLIQTSPLIQTLNLLLRTTEMDKANAKLKTKQHPLSKFQGVEFNPNSGPQLQRLLYEQMGLPVIDYTDTKQPATGADTLEKLINHCTQPTYKELLETLIKYGKITKILSTFIPAFETAIAKAPDGIVWLYGSFNLGGTVSGRLSSSDPNLQNLPANSTYGKLIKSCFMAALGWLFCGADFHSLEDYISALTTRDPNKLKVYERGFDGHCLRAAFYYDDQLSHIDVDDPKSVNTIEKTHKHLRQESKTPTFALTYQGTYHTLMVNEGWDMEKAKRIEAKYHELYKVSDDYIQARLKQASKDGYVTVAFGLRVRTPLLKQVVFGASGMPYEAAAEGRTAGNAMGQSYGLLNNRAAVDFWRKVWASKYRLDILPVALIHDAIYAVIRDDVEVVEWANRELIKSMQWQELPEIQHPTVKLGAALDIYWPHWAKAITLPNDADQATIRKLCDEAKEKNTV